MALFLKILWDNRKVAIWILIVAAVALMGWRVNAWHAGYKRLGEVEAQLAAETACAVDSECHKRAAALAEQARIEAEERAQDALQVAQEAEAKARADAQAWRRRYEAALRNEPECKAWSEQPISCPL